MIIRGGRGERREIRGWEGIGQEGKKERTADFRCHRTPVKCASFVFCEEFNPSTIFRTYGAGWARKVRRKEQQISDVRPARNALATPGIARLSRGGRACEAGGGQMTEKGRRTGRAEERERRSEGYIYVPMIIALISFKIFLMEGIFDGLILAGVCLWWG